MLYSLVLAMLDCDAECAEDGDAALKLYYDHGPFDVVITDVLHPGKDGVALAALIKEFNPNQTILILTGADPDCLVVPENVTVQQIPFTRAELFALLESLLKAKAYSTSVQ